MGKALLGWAGFIGLAFVLYQAFTAPPSARQLRATAAAHRTLAEIEVRADNARYACAHGVVGACR